MTFLEPTSSREFLPVFSMDWFGLLRKVKQVEGNYGILAPIHCTNNFLQSVRETGKPFFIDRGVFAKKEQPWYLQKYAEFKQGYWKRETRLATEISDKTLQSFSTDAIALALTMFLRLISLESLCYLCTLLTSALMSTLVSPELIS